MACEKVRTIKAMQMRACVCSSIRLEAVHRSLYDSALYSSREIMSYNDRSAQCKQSKPGYFRQYRNPVKGASCKNGPYGHPT